MSVLQELLVVEVLLKSKKLSLKSKKVWLNQIKKDFGKVGITLVISEISEIKLMISVMDIKIICDAISFYAMYISDVRHHDNINVDDVIKSYYPDMDEKDRKSFAQHIDTLASMEEDRLLEIEDNNYCLTLNS